ncbi:MAG: hypothetical protein HYX42_04145 [Polaromonas sp.]|uniref:hypothetical protein n=1 Tax=Polaromonas sp. TaxID=1869339 RepID=UPI0025EF61A1|nr:hypothetical protein [Polaromonas sp.]MBI2725421.1 hypothetical protein [Polaromonas sp.]
MKDTWQVFFFTNVPVWQYGAHITMFPTDSGPVPVLHCTSVMQGIAGLLELTVLDEAKNLELTYLVPAPNVLTAIRLRTKQDLGFSPPLLSTLVQPETPVLPGS